MLIFYFTKINYIFEITINRVSKKKEYPADNQLVGCYVREIILITLKDR
jgi:hypothetical protein